MALKEQQMSLLTLMKTTGAFFTIAGAVLLFKPEYGAEFLNFDAYMTKILGGALMAAGILDLAVVPIILKTAFEKQATDKNESN